jgi:hypothetical protein
MFCKCGYSLSGFNMFLLEHVDDIQYIITSDSLYIFHDWLVSVRILQCQSMNIGLPLSLFHLRLSFLQDKRPRKEVGKKASKP